MTFSRLLRDLHWVISSPPLMDGVPTFAEPTLSQIAPSHLQALVDRVQGKRVGRYFERLVGYYLEHVRGCVDVQHSCQVRDQNRTTGEIDFMFTDEIGRRTHWEAAVKFYLHHPIDNASGSHFIGPNAADTFERKTARLLGHQLRLSETHFPLVTVRRPFVKGRIFYHPDFDCANELPQHLSIAHLRGSWIRQSQLDWLATTKLQRYRVLRKPYWLSNEVAELSDDSMLSGTQIVDHLNECFAQSDRPVLVSQLEPSEQCFVEVNRIFVVSDCWPAADHVPPAVLPA